MAVPNIPNIKDLLAAGIDPATNLPTRMVQADLGRLKKGIEKTMAVLDVQDAVNRYVWYNLPSGLTGQLLERILYYCGQAAFFYLPNSDEFFFLPYSLQGTIDVYGRFQGVTPIIFKGGNMIKKINPKDDKDKPEPWIPDLKLTPVYDISSLVDEESIMKAATKGCVILKDYTPNESEIITPRFNLQAPICEAMSEAFPMARTCLFANSGIKGVRVSDEDSADSVRTASKNIVRASLSGSPWVPIVGSMEFQELTTQNAMKTEEYLLYMQAVDNFRLSLYGLDSGGIFQKKSHMLEAEQSMNANRSKAAYQDGLTLRQNFCDMVNSIWGLGIVCEPSESALAMDQDGDGSAIDKKDQSGQMQGEQPEQAQEGDEQ